MSDRCFFQISNDCIEQYKIILKNNFFKSTANGFIEIEFSYSEDANVFISEGKLIAFKDNDDAFISISIIIY